MKKLFSNPVLVVALLLVCAPLGIVVMYKCTEWDSNYKMGLAIVFLIIWIASIVMSFSQEAQIAAQGLRGYVI